MRADLYLVSLGIAESRQKAKNLIDAGNVCANGKTVKKASQEIDVASQPSITLIGQIMPYVSRGGLKLEEALKAFSVDVKDMLAIDFGASTGGFTDCLLQNGAKKVISVDSGSDQLHPKLKHDARVVSMENCNARYLTLADIGGEQADIAVCDLSFVSQTKIYDTVRGVLKDGGIFISLIKPQFEAGREYLNKHGIVKDERVRLRVKDFIRDEARRKGLKCLGMTDSPISGGDGNKEYLAIFRKENTTAADTRETERDAYGN